MQPASPPESQAALTFTDVKPPFVTVEISSKTFEALVDTGATKSRLSDRIHHLLHKVVFPSENVELLWMGNGNLVTPIGYCTTSFRIGDQCYVAPFVVLSKCVSDVILGWDFLSSHDVLTDCTNSELHLNDYDIVDHPSTNFNIPLRAMDDIVVPPRCSLIAMFALDTASPHERTCVIVNPDSQLLLKKI